MSWPLRETMADDSVNVAVHPLSQNCPTERRDPEARDRKTCTSLASEGKFGILRFA